MKRPTRVAKALSAVVFAFGVLTFPLTVWSTADFASKKGWLWRGLADIAKASPWVPASLVVVGAGFFGWAVIVDRHRPATGSVEPESLRDRLHGGSGPLFPRPGDPAFAVRRQEAQSPTQDRARWRATYEFRRDPRYGPGVTLRIQSLAGEEFAYYVCRVTNPHGQVAEGRPKVGGFIPVARPEAAIHYPGQFRGVVLMPPGEYLVEWYGLAGLRPDSGKMLLARATHMVREGQLIP